MFERTGSVIEIAVTCAVSNHILSGIKSALEYSLKIVFAFSVFGRMWAFGVRAR
jgi:hypothetical protein